MPSVFLDTNVLVYAAIGATDGTKSMKAIEIVRTTPFAISAQVMAEFVYTVRRKSQPRIRESDLEMWLDRLERRVAAPVDAPLVRRGVAISRRHRISYYDGAIVAAAERLGCETLYTENMSDGQLYGPVRVEDPFRGL